MYDAGPIDESPARDGHRLNRIRGHGRDGADDGAAGLGPGPGPNRWRESQFAGPAGLAAMVRGVDAFLAQVMPGFHGLSALLTGLGILFLTALIAQGPRDGHLQFFDLPGHIRLCGTRCDGSGSPAGWLRRQSPSPSWPGRVPSNGLSPRQRQDRPAPVDQVVEDERGGYGAGVLAGSTPPRYVAGLGDNLPLLILAAIVVFRASIDPQKSGEPGEAASRRGRPRPGWTTRVGEAAALYILYQGRCPGGRSGTVDLPLGGCLIVEAILIPIAMLLADGFLLAWILTEFRNAKLDVGGQHRLDALQAISLLPGAVAFSASASPSRNIATFVFLPRPTCRPRSYATALGEYVRWQLGWGLVDIQAARASPLSGSSASSPGAAAGSVEAIAGYGRLLPPKAATWSPR